MSEERAMQSEGKKGTPVTAFSVFPREVRGEEAKAEEEGLPWPCDLLQFECVDRIVMEGLGTNFSREELRVKHNVYQLLSNFQMCLSARS